MVQRTIQDVGGGRVSVCENGSSNEEYGVIEGALMAEAKHREH